ncbi:hypothetical protein Dsin_009148 [Dipteronia sinensis]|uniref:Fungal lipase-type domain-containing protein n=1 Tax=Dipteronia sinensis TaxID=43782 RepID=A0AAE0AQI1_9ROSI|nr:hypothetical protein Dsin_009148 [Dipteronia sinensis]
MGSDCDKSFCTNHMLLNPDKVGLFDLINILFSSNIKKRKFVESSEVEEQDFWRRWILFISIVVQKLLLFFSKPMSIFGSAIEFFLNLLSINGNLASLLLNLVQGKVTMPVKNSASFLSVTGNVDKRVKLDSSIKPGDNERYFGALSMMASKVAYENKAYIETVVTNHWKVYIVTKLIKYYQQKKATTQAFICYDKNEVQDTIVVSFRGTEPFDADAWCTDFDLSWYEIKDLGKIHGGFMKALGLQKNKGWPTKITEQESCCDQLPLAYYAIRDMLRELLSKNERAKFILTGHSLGGALAILFPAILALHKETWLLKRLEGVYTFGQPRVGDDKFVEVMEKKFKEHEVKYFRFVYCNDIVPRLPFDNSELMFKHFGKCLYFNSLYQGKVVKEEPNKNYFSPLYWIPMRINSVKELIRSFTLAYKKGPDYREGGLLRVLRIIGLVVPGISSHCTQDYVNSTRLGSSDVLSHTKTL